jgi:hypothetical protein
VKGRLDKKFCGEACRSAFNNRRQREERREIGQIDLILKHNRRILRDLIDDDDRPRRVEREELLQLGFRFEYFTHHYTNARGQQYCFCYDYGYLVLEEGICLVVRGRGDKSGLKLAG